jgi:hypothetical protein
VLAVVAHSDPALLNYLNNSEFKIEVAVPTVLGSRHNLPTLLNPLNPNNPRSHHDPLTPGPLAGFFYPRPWFSTNQGLCPPPLPLPRHSLDMAMPSPQLQHRMGICSSSEVSSVRPLVMISTCFPPVICQRRCCRRAERSHLLGLGMRVR